MVAAIFNQENVNHVVGDAYFLAIFLSKRRTILTIHDCAFAYHKSPLIRFLFILFWLKLPVAASKYVTAVSEYTRKDILKFTNADPDKIKLIPNFALPHFKPVAKPFKKEKPVLLHVGAYHNLNPLIKAITGLKCHLHIIGTPSKSHVREMEAKNIEYTYQADLFKAEIAKAYADCDIVTFISFFEGFGLPIIEANVMQRPVITGNSHAIPEVAGDAALMVNPRDTNEIREGILQIISDDAFREQLVQNGIKNAKRFNFKNSVKAYFELYQGVVSGE